MEIPGLSPRHSGPITEKLLYLLDKIQRLRKKIDHTGLLTDQAQLIRFVKLQDSAG